MKTMDVHWNQGNNNLNSNSLRSSRERLEQQDANRLPINENHPRKRTKLKRVTWAETDNLKKIRLYNPEDPPVFVSGVSEDSFALTTGFHYNLSHGFNPDGQTGYGPHRIRSDSAAVAFVVEQVNWKKPDALLLDPDWTVASGEESEEVEVQNQRGIRSLEAIYPRPINIPESPQEPEMTEKDTDNSQTPAIFLYNEKDPEPSQEPSPESQLPRSHYSMVSHMTVSDKASPNPARLQIQASARNYSPRPLEPSSHYAPAGRGPQRLLGDERSDLLSLNPLHFDRQIRKQQQEYSLHDEPELSAEPPLRRPNPYPHRTPETLERDQGFRMGSRNEPGSFSEPAERWQGSGRGGGEGFGRGAGGERALCWYYNSDRGCRNGDSCQFLHEKGPVSRPVRGRGAGSRRGGRTGGSYPY